MEIGLHDDRRGGDQQRRPQDHLQPGLDHRSTSEAAEDQDTGKGRRNRTDAQPLDDLPIDRASSGVDAAADRLHDHGCDQVARDGRQWLDLEQKDQDRRHERAAAHASQADGEADQESCQCDVRVDVHGCCR